MANALNMFVTALIQVTPVACYGMIDTLGIHQTSATRKGLLIPDVCA
jgi:hypothetical protein